MHFDTVDGHHPLGWFSAFRDEHDHRRIVALGRLDERVTDGAAIDAGSDELHGDRLSPSDDAWS
jgi:hypothetical protein